MKPTGMIKHEMANDIQLKMYAMLPFHLEFHFAIWMPSRNRQNKYFLVEYLPSACCGQETDLRLTATPPWRIVWKHWS